MERTLNPSPEKAERVLPNLPPTGGQALLLRDPDQVATLMHADLRLAVTQIMAELFNQQTLVVVTGEAGVGKSLLLREIGRVLRAAEWRVANETQVESILKRPPPGPTAVLIDGADRISPSQMQDLRRLKTLAIVLALPDTPEPRIPFCAPIRLKPMSAGASAQFISAWFRQTETRPDLLNRDGIARVVELSRGIPRHLASLLHELAKSPSSSATPLSRTDIDEAARRLALVVDSAPQLEKNSARTLDHFEAERNRRPRVAVASPSFERDPDQIPTVGFRRLLPTNPGSAALTGLLCGIGAAIVGLLLQDLLAGSRDDVADNRAAHILTAPVTADTVPGRRPLAPSPSGTPTGAQSESP